MLKNYKNIRLLQLYSLLAIILFVASCQSPQFSPNENMQSKDAQLQSDNMQNDNSTDLAEPEEQINSNIIESNIKKNQIIDMDNKTKIKVGLFLPLSGKNAEIGNKMLNAIHLSYKMVNNKNIIIKIYDTKSSASEVENVAKLAINNDKINIAIGPVFSDEVSTLSKVLLKNNIPILSFSNNTSVLNDNPNMYTLSFLPNVELERSIYFALKEKQAQKFAILAAKNAYGDLVVDFATQILKSYGIEDVKIVRYPANEIRLMEYIIKLVPKDNLDKYIKLQDKYNESKKNKTTLTPEELLELEALPPLDFDTLIIGDFGKRLNVVASHFAFAYVDYKNLIILGNSNWRDNAILSDPILKQSFYPYYGDIEKSAYGKLFYGTYGNYPSLIEISGAESIMVISNLFYKDFEGTMVFDNSKNNLTSTGYNGILGSFKFRQDGSLVRDMTIYEVRGKNITSISPVIKYQDFITTTAYVKD